MIYSIWMRKTELDIIVQIWNLCFYYSLNVYFCWIFLLTNYRDFFGAYKLPDTDSDNLHDDTKWLQAKTGLLRSNDMDTLGSLISGGARLFIFR